MINYIDKDSTEPKTPNKKEMNVLILENVNRLLKGREKVLYGFASKIFPIGKQTHGDRLKGLTPKQMLQSLSIALAQVIHLKAC